MTAQPKAIHDRRLPESLRNVLTEIWSLAPSEFARQTCDLPSGQWRDALDERANSSCVVMSESSTEAADTALGWFTQGKRWVIGHPLCPPELSPSWIRHKGKFMYELVSFPSGQMHTALPPQGLLSYISASGGNGALFDLPDTKLMLALCVLQKLDHSYRHPLYELENAGASFSSSGGGIFVNEAEYWLRCRVLESKHDNEGGFHILSEIESVRMNYSVVADLFEPDNHLTGFPPQL